ncbi:hypothetical protein L345_01997, partial [Ophiophagus hannah]
MQTNKLNMIHIARQLIEKHHEKRQQLHMAFLDLEKTFDHIPHQMIWYILRDHSVSELLIDWVKMLYKNTSSQDSVATNASETSRSLQIYQGWLSSPPQTVMSSVCIALSHHLQINMAISDTSSCSHSSLQFVTNHPKYHTDSHRIVLEKNAIL